MSSKLTKSDIDKLNAEAANILDGIAESKILCNLEREKRRHMTIVHDILKKALGKNYDSQSYRRKPMGKVREDSKTEYTS